jgi:hypothetical protein
MVLFLSIITSVKDYIEVVHKLVESEALTISSGNTQLEIESGQYGIPSVASYNDLGTILTFFILSVKEFSSQFLSNVWSIPIVVPKIASAMVSEMPVLDSFTNMTGSFSVLETPLNETVQPTSLNLFLYSFEKLLLGFINSFFLWLPTSVTHLILLRRFVIQGLEAGYIAGLGTIAGNFLWIFSIIFGLRFLIIPWISLDFVRYILGFVLLTKYMWDCYNEKKIVLEDLSKWKIFTLSFLLALTEQTSIYPFISNISIGPESTIIEPFFTTNLIGFFCIHGSYILGILLGSLSLLHLMCWFWENPAFSLYMWIISFSKMSPGSYYKFVNFSFLYLTMICTICSVPYFGLDYSLTNPVGFVHEDKIFAAETRSNIQKPFLETSFLYSKASDRNTRIKRGRRSRAERWKKRLDKYRAFDASLYDQGVFDLFTIEDINYGFDRFWLRRKMRRHVGKFRIARSLLLNMKKQILKPAIESGKSPRLEFFRILFEQAYHPTFHEYKKTILKNNEKTSETKNESTILQLGTPVAEEINIIQQQSTLRKFIRKFTNRLNKSKEFMKKKYNSEKDGVLLRESNFISLKSKILTESCTKVGDIQKIKKASEMICKNNIILTKSNLFHPIKYYLEKEKAFQRRLNYYGVNIFRKFSIQNNAPFFRILMKRLFYYYKPTIRWEKTLLISQQKKIRRKTLRQPRKLKEERRINNYLSDYKFQKENQASKLFKIGIEQQNLISKNPTYSYSVLGKRASRYRSQIYKDVLQHWYYSPFNRLLLKTDIDSFISRQPKNHFITTKEEHLLNLRRFLLLEHYDTLRWYTYMQHYRTMKARIGGTKSFANRIYNQQFAGTFKKIRHLFAITFQNGTSNSYTQNEILKYDKFLYTDSTFVTGLNSYFHEEIGPVFNESFSTCSTQDCQSITDVLPHVDFPDLELNSPKKLNEEEMITSLQTLPEVGSVLDTGIKKVKVLEEKNIQKLKTQKKYHFDKKLFNKYITRKIDKKQMRRKTNERKKRILKERLFQYSQEIKQNKKEDTNLTNPIYSSPQQSFSLIKKAFGFLKYLGKREKTENYYQEKIVFNKTKMKTRKKLGYLYKIKIKIKNKKKKNETKFLKQILNEKNPIQTELQISQSSRTNSLNNKLNNYSIFWYNQDLRSTMKRQKREKNTDKKGLNQWPSLYIKKGYISFYEKGLAKEYLSQPNRIKKAKNFKKFKIKKTALSQKDIKRTLYVKRYWRIYKKSKKMKIPKNYFVTTKLRKAAKKIKHKNINRKMITPNTWLTENIFLNKNIKRLEFSNIQLKSIINTKNKKNSLTICQKINNCSDNLIENYIKKQITSNTEFLPYYAGWDETLRKFVITNYLLSRQDTGNDSFFQGLNNHTTLYWRVPFSTYDQDQFFSAGRQGFAPIKWRRFEFRQSLIKIWKKLQNTFQDPIQPLKVGSILTNSRGFKKVLLTERQGQSTQSSSSNVKKFNRIFKPHKKKKLSKIRFIQKRYHRFRRLRPGKPYLAQSGQLLNQVLPAHYLYVFSKENRFDKDRYVSPKLYKYNKNNHGIIPNLETEKKPLSIVGISDNNRFDLTLRRRIKTRRKYHQKRQKNILGQLLPRRYPFVGKTTESPRWRPFSKERSSVKIRQKQIRSATEQRTAVNRVRQSRRRIFRGVIKPRMWLRPYIGGFVWPNDYLRLELKRIIKIEQANQQNENKGRTFQRKNKKGIRNEYIMYQTHPKKFLIERHNIKVIKRKLEKVQRKL